ncbi:MAG: proline dehydrogenase family protein [Planctomycetota bacterium]|jgi:proline dehydrogenase
MLRTFFVTLSHSRLLRWLCAHFAPARRIARRFIAGESLDDAVEVVKKLNSLGMAATLNHLGEKVRSCEDARRAAEEYIRILERIKSEGLDATISIKPTHLGLDFGTEFFQENLGRIAKVAASLGNSVEVDIEDHPTIDDTIAAFLNCHKKYKNLRLALQAYLFRTSDDLQKLIEHESGVRLVKGAYDEPSELAWKTKEEVDENFVRLIEHSFKREARAAGFEPAFGTHDHNLIDYAVEAADKLCIEKKEFEFQMLLGIRRDWQERLAGEGYRMRIYVPFGTQWYPYFMRRLAERPANVLFMMRAMVGR